jgi:transposase InsO family protein
MHLAWRWFTGLGFDQEIPHHRRLTFMMLDADGVAVSPTSVWRALKQAGLLSRWKAKPSAQGEQPLQHWHIDVSYINVYGTFYYLCSVLDGCSRFLVRTPD